ncbi:MAG TPA: hypothetical protein VFX98_12240 [Longimicrobiaceae bacterium]|nr:hypothetical protein [Longimicrobiaceae bacterium]
MDVEALRPFMADLVLKLGLRHVGEMIGRGHEQVRKFVNGSIQRPQERTRKAMAELFLRYHQPAYAAERPVARLAGPELRSLLPEGLEAAGAVVRAVFDLARRHPDELPPEAAALEKHLLRQLKEEYREAAVYVLPATRRRR